MPAVPARQRIVVPFDGHVIGEGFNSDTAERVGTALTADNVGADPTAPGQSAVFRFQMLTSQASLEKALNIGAQIDARYALFSAGGKFNFAENSAVNSSSTYIVASCIITNARRFGVNFQPTEQARPLITAGDFDGFKRAFGDRFTQALHTGGEFHALVRVTSSNMEHQRRIAASLNAELNGLTAGASFKASLEESRKDTSSHTEVDIQIHQTGGIGEQIQIPATEADRIREHMNRFAAAANTGAVAYQAELATYDTLALAFPPLEELEERRAVLEDCLARRRRYWSAISDLTFAQSEDADLIFDNLPSLEEITALEAAFRTSLNKLMAHARKVSSGVIPPEFFVPEDEPVLPPFKRRTSTSFASWWARAKSGDPTLLRDERLLIEDITRAVRHMIDGPVEQAKPETMERATDLLDELHLNTGSDHLDTPRHRSLKPLPKMIDAPLRYLGGHGVALDDLAGVEEFPRLEKIDFFDGRLRDLTALASVPGLRELNLGKNVIFDLTPLAALTGLRELRLDQNRIEDLGPLHKLSNLEVLNIADNNVESLEPLRGLPALRVLLLNVRRSPEDIAANPIEDATALADLPRLANPFTSAAQLRLRVIDHNGAVTRTGIATRVGDTNRFDFVSDADGSHEELEVQGLGEWDDLRFFPEPVVVTSVRFSSDHVGIACTKPDRSTFVPAADLLELSPDPIPFGRTFPEAIFNLSMLVDQKAPQLYLDVEPVA